MKRIILILMWLLLPAMALAQVTGFSDTFDGELKATGPATFGFEQKDGVLHVDVDKNASTTWQAIAYDIGTSLNLTDNPYVLVRLKVDNPCVLSVYIQDAYWANDVIHNKIYASDTFVDYFIDFSEKGIADKSFINAILFTPNGNTQDAFEANLYIDDLKIGSDAIKTARIGAVNSQKIFVNSLANKITLLDLDNATGVSAVSKQGLLDNISLGAINNSRASLSFDAGDNVIGNDTLLVTAAGETGYADNAIVIPVSIQANNPPTIDPIQDMHVMEGDTATLLLSGISDGNSTVEQDLVFQVHSSDQNAIPDSSISIVYEQGTPNAELTFVAVQPAIEVQLTVTLDDQYAGNNIQESVFAVSIFSNMNQVPTIDKVEDQFVYLENGAQTITLAGISDGDDGSQALIFSAASSVDSVISNDALQIEHSAGTTTAVLNFTPASTGVTTITVTLADNGATPGNNGDQQTVIAFDITVGNIPVTGHVGDFSSFNNWGVDALGTQQEAELGTFKGRDNVLKLTLNNKSCWTGTMYFPPEMNVDEHRYISYDIYFEGESFHLTPPSVGQGNTHCYFWDDGWDADLDRNVEAAHEQRKRVFEGEWTTVLMDFRGATGMNNSENKEINVKRIQKILLNYASVFSWPFPSDNGTVYISNLRIGSAVPDSLLPILPTVCTLKPIPAQVMFKNANSRTIELTGITSGKDNPAIPEITIASSDTTVITVPTISELDGDMAVLTFAPVEGVTGTSTITVTVSAENASPRNRVFRVDVIEQQGLVTLELDRDTLFQEIKGFGTFQFEGQRHYLNLYTDDLGASAVRTGLISNQIELSNDNSDPNVLNLDGYNRNAFDFDYYRQLKEKGVETFILTSWSPPAWMKENLSVSYAFAAAPDENQTDNKLEPYYYDEFAESMVAAVKMFQIHADITLDAIGPQNEPAFCEPYASAVMSPASYANLVTVIGERFKKEGLSTKLYMPEQVFTQAHYSMEQYINSILSRPLADEYTHIIATHGYGTSGVNAQQPNYSDWSEMWRQTQQSQFPKELWMSETYPEYTTWEDALSLAGAIHGALVWGNVSLWTLWNIEGTLINSGIPTPSFYTSKNYYKYIRPGARRFRVYEDNDDILASGFIHPETRQQTLVIINKGDNPISLVLGGNYHADSYDQYTTAKFMNFEYMGGVSPGESIALPASSVTTLVGEIEGPIVTEIDDTMVPQGFQLYQNYPNPFNPQTTIRFQLPAAAHTSIEIYNVLGQKVRSLVNNTFTAGQHEIIWNGLNDNSMQVSSGLYFYRIVSGSHVKTLKCVLVR